jgi:hypothetical protein
MAIANSSSSGSKQYAGTFSFPALCPLARRLKSPLCIKDQTALTNAHRANTPQSVPLFRVEDQDIQRKIHNNQITGKLNLFDH